MAIPVQERYSTSVGIWDRKRNKSACSSVLSDNLGHLFFLFHGESRTSETLRTDDGYSARHMWRAFCENICHLFVSKHVQEISAIKCAVGGSGWGIFRFREAPFYLLVVLSELMFFCSFVFHCRFFFIVYHFTSDILSAIWKFRLFVRPSEEVATKPFRTSCLFFCLVYSWRLNWCYRTSLSDNFRFS